MNKRKRLPKAVVWTADDLREAGPMANQRSELPKWADLKDPLSERAASPSTGSLDNVIEIVPKSETPSAAISNTTPHPAFDDADVLRLRRQARAIVERYANLSAIGGVIPLPVANVATVTAIIVRMVKSLSGLYGVPFEHNRARAIVIGLMGGVMPTGLATVTTSTLTYVVPGYNLLGLAVSSVTASAAARSIGRLLIEYFEKGSTLIDLSSAVSR
jgi:uncharacterized protein (DUF697 family)